MRTEDGVALHVEEHGPADAAATFVLAHGYTQAGVLWSGQVRDLLDGRDDLKVVVYDHRGHGRSTRTSREAATLEQLGRDLAAVLQATAPTGPLLLGGHSMGGMALLALAEQHPELVRDRVVGAAFVGTSAGALDTVSWGLPGPVAPLFKALLPIANERALRAEIAGRSRRQMRRFEAYLNFAEGADPADVRAVLDVQKACRAETVAFFLATFSGHDRATALDALSGAHAVVVVGERDRLCPVQHSRTLAAALPLSELAIYPGAGHMVHLERRPEVSRRLLDLVERALAGRAGAGLGATG